MRPPTLACFLALTACGGGDAHPDAGADADPLAGTTELDVAVPATGRVYVSLAQAAVVTPADPAHSADWDLAFDGYDVLTNSGVSGPGSGGAFGPLDLDALAGSNAPDVPFLTADKAGGAFLDWYAYDGGAHVLYSRFHVYGVRRAARTWKLQVLTYYGVEDGAPTSARYQVRYAEVTSATTATQTLAIDGTAGGLAGSASAPSGCLDLATGAAVMLAPDDAQASSAWDVCFRRDAISVNGEVGGPRGDGAVDLDAAQTAGEELSAVEAKTAGSEQAHFDGAGSAAFASSAFRGDHVVSAFESGRWIDPASSPPALAPDQAWLVVDASGAHEFVLSFTAFTNPTTSSPGTIVIHLKPVSG